MEFSIHHRCRCAVEPEATEDQCPQKCMPICCDFTVCIWAEMEPWKNIVMYSVPCLQSYSVFHTNISLVLIGQPSPENDNTIKDLLPEDAGIDHQTVHQLITVLMKFMAKDESSAESDISSAKAFNTVKRHLYVLLGYDQQEGCFMIAPQKMRVSTCFNAFIAGIAQVGEGTYYFLQLFLIACC